MLCTKFPTTLELSQDETRARYCWSGQIYGWAQTEYTLAKTSAHLVIENTQKTWEDVLFMQSKNYIYSQPYSTYPITQVKNYIEPETTFPVLA